MSRIETILPERQITSLDLLEEMNNGGAVSVARRGVPVWGNQSQLLASVAAAPTVARVGGDGLFWRRATSAAATQTGNFMTVPGWPVGNDYTGFPAYSLLPVEWRFQLLVKRGGPLVADAPAFFGIVGNSMSNPASTAFPLFGFNSATTENGGNWTSYLRSRKAGGIVAQDSGIDPTAAHLLELVYRDSTAPQIQLLIDGVVVRTVAGIANVPQQGAADNDWCVGFINGRAAGGGVGQVDLFRQARLILTEQPGYV